MSRSFFADPLCPERIERSRAWINANAPAIMVLAAASMLLLMFTVRSQLVEKPKPEYVAWYYDTITGEYFKGDPFALSPIQSPYGHEAVRVSFYNCAQCDPSEPLLRIFEKYDAKALAEYHRARQDPGSVDEWAEDPSETLYESRLASFDGVNWFPAGTDYEEPEEKLARKCAGGDLQYVTEPY